MKKKVRRIKKKKIKERIRKAKRNEGRKTCQGCKVETLFGKKKRKRKYLRKS